MPEIHIDLFGTAFTWSGTEAEAADLLAAMREQAAQFGPADEVMESILLHHAPTTLKGDEELPRGTMAMVTAWALQQPAGHPEVPGSVINFLPEHDFEVAITRDAAGQVSAEIEASVRDETGSE